MVASGGAGVELEYSILAIPGKTQYICAPISKRLAMNTFQLSGEARTDTGKKATRQDRANGLIPCVVYGRKGAEHFTVTQKDVRKLVFTPTFNVVELSLGSETKRAIVKDVQYHPTTDDIRHMDFLLLEDGHPVKASIPLRTKGVSPGVKGGGRLVQTVRDIKVKAMPDDLADELFIDISELELGFAVRVRDIDVPEGVQIMTNQAVPVALVDVPRALRSANTAADKLEGEGEGEEGDAEGEGETSAEE